MKYVKQGEGNEIQLIKAQKPLAGSEYYDPESRMKKLERDIKRDMLIERLVKEGKPIYGADKVIKS